MTPAERDLLIAVAECLFSARGSAPGPNVHEWREALEQVKRERDAADPVGHAMRVSNDELRIP